MKYIEMKGMRTHKNSYNVNVVSFWDLEEFS